MDVLGGLSAIVCSRVALPFDQILLLFPLPICVLTQNLLHFIFFFTLNHIRWRFQEVCSVFTCFMIW